MTQNASHDENHVATLIAALNSDGATVVPVAASPSSHRLMVSDAMSGSDNGPVSALHDENHVPTLLAVSSVDGVTPVVVYSDSNGHLLVNSQ